MYRKGLLVLIAVLLISSAVYAQDGMYARNELSFAAAYADIASISAFLAAAHYGRFITPNLEAQLAFIWAHIDFGGGDLDAVAVAPALAYHFISPSTTSVVPYVGVGWYFFDVSNGGSFDNNGIELFAGAKFFLGGDYRTSNRAIFAEWRFLNDPVDSGDNLNTVMVGITNFF